MLLLLFPISLYRVPGAAQTREKARCTFKNKQVFCSAALARLREMAKL
jgi:hypothetical protein